MRLPDPERSRVVLIGTSRYEDEKLPDLPAVGRGVEGLKDAITDSVYGLVPENHCDLLEDEGDIRLIGRRLRRAAAEAQDLLLVYFAGHGLTAGRRHELYLALRDTEWEEPEFSALEYDKLRSAVLNSPATTKMIILDCCFSGRVFGDTMADPATEVIGQVEVDGSYVLASASRDQVSLILPGEDHTVFTGSLLRLFHEGVPGGPELLTIDDIYQQLRAQMKAEGLPQPHKRGSDNANLLALAQNRAFAVTAAPLPPELQQAIENPLPRIKVAAVQELARILRGKHVGMALAARLALEQLTDDDSRTVAAAATTALGAATPPPRPELLLSDTAIDLGRLPQHGQSPERRVRISNAGGGALNARAATAARWLKVRQVGDELVVAVDTSEAGEFDGTVTVDSDGGTATIRVQARVDPAHDAQEGADRQAGETGEAAAVGGQFAVRPPRIERAARADQFAYQDFDLLIEPGSRGSYQARVLQSPAGECAPVQFTPPFSPLELENFMLKVSRGRARTRGVNRPESAALKAFGGKLYGAVFQDELRDLWQRSLSLTRAQQVGLRLRLRLADTPELAEVPWEFLYDPRHNRFLVQSLRTPLVRYLDLPDPPRLLSVDGPLRLLVMISSPTDYPALDVEHEWSALTGALAQQLAEGRVIVEGLAANMSTLRKQLRRREFHVFHFVGHGRYRPDWGDGVLVMEDRNGRPHEVTGEELGGLLNEYDQTRLAVLNACEGARSGVSDPFAGVAQSLIRQGLPAVVAMQFEITDDAAIIFAREFYGPIADGYPVEAALAEARGAIRDEGNLTEWGTPVLYSRVPDGHLFDLTGRERISEADRKSQQEADRVARAEPSVRDQLNQLRVLQRQGVITDDEFAEAEAKLFGPPQST
jgi:hypothetical protein